MLSVFRTRTSILLTACFAATAALGNTESDMGRSTAFQMAVAEFTPQTSGISEFYRTNGFKPIWVGDTAQHAQRRAALIQALSNAHMHGLPASDFDVQALIDQMGQARVNGGTWARLRPNCRGFLWTTPTRFMPVRLIRRGLTTGLFAKSNAAAAAEHLQNLRTQGVDYLDRIAPQTRQYRALLKQKITLEDLVAQGGWGATVPSDKLEFGDSGPNVIKLRNRLVAMGLYETHRKPDFR